MEKSKNNVDFTKDETNGTFYRTTYCEACPWCGAHKKGEKWEAKGDGECGDGKKYAHYVKTEIPILTPQEQSDIFQKYKSFCTSVKDTSNGGGGTSGGVPSGRVASGGDSGGAANSTTPGKNDNQIVTWTCYYKKKKWKG
ncbi:hypothetical protein PFMALIP_06028 [Plasmodium falciparum MaliPS096_E11]|uniref:Duffy-binding-like domain-containing protein n=1 Tax=Plasmodium falciparum MaliPS096_E11 TaxID=1036727 RepID=A0A024WHC7_PLAFA|nr:hypothetical protein PFMALIP_06028 [Plasmodium falciparum MaliPS096_E11]